MMQIRFSGFSTKNKNAINHNLYGKDLIIEDLMNNLMTRKGERIMMPTYGSIIHDLIFEPLTPELKDLIRKDINYIIDGDPRVRLEVLNITDTNHTIDIQLSVSIIPTNEKVELTLNLERE
ncbi:GPW/gp25 family protein [bacterium]|nr:GPW/gp25 family protein [bacterium]